MPSDTFDADDTCVCGHVADEHEDGHRDCCVEGCLCVMVETEESHGY